VTVARFDERALYAATVVVLVGFSAVGLALSGAPGQAAPEPPSADEADFQVTDDGTRYTVHPSQLLQGCPGGTDCIPSIDDPNFQSAGKADWLADEDLVIGVEMNGEARAYPLRILNVHEIVNDEIDGRPVAVTYCPLCRSGLVFDRRMNGSTLEFGVSGKLLNANLVMYDRQTETYWSQLNGSAIVGPLVPRQLTILPNTITTWEKWRENHPDTEVLSRDTGIYPKSSYGSNPYGSYADREGVGFGVDEVDDRLPSKTIVYGVTIGNASRAYPEKRVESEDVVNDVVEDVPVLVVEDQREGGVKVFVREVDDETLHFSIEDDRLVDGAGNRWSFDGEALEGPREGTKLERLNSHGIFWFAWSEFNPETGIYPNDASGENE